MAFWRRLASWRQDPHERLAQESFLEDIAQNWTPVTTVERRLEWRARASHLMARLFDGSGTLAPVVVSLIPSTLAVVVQPSRAEYATAPPPLAYLLFTIGAIGLACEAAASPHAVRPRRWSLFAAPIALGSVIADLGTGRHLVADQMMVAGFGLLAVGMIVIAAVPVVVSRRRSGLLRAGMVISGLGALLLVAGDLYWTQMLRADGENMLAVGTGLASVGCWLFGTALLRCRPAIAVRAAAVPF
jgi:hypothetical protein